MVVHFLTPSHSGMLDRSTFLFRVEDYIKDSQFYRFNLKGSTDSYIKVNEVCLNFIHTFLS